MKLSMSFKNVRSTTRLEHIVQEKSQRMAKFFEGETSVAWTFSKADGGVTVDIKVTGPSQRYNASCKTDNIYNGLDAAIMKIEKQVIRKKEKVKNKIHRGKGAKEANVLTFTAKKTWEREVEMYNESLEKAA